MENALQELERFQKDRLLHKKSFNIKVASLNIIEELLEAHGAHDNDSRDVATAVYDSMFAIAEHHVVTDTTVDYITPTEEDQVDAFADITVFATGDIMKLGYNPEKVLCEVGKEINSRTGEIVNGKFQKYKTPEAMALWYKADFSDCKL